MKIRIGTDELVDIEIGDTITFRAITRWSGAKATRKVKGFTANGQVEVRYGGWGRFVLRNYEILSIESH